MAATVLSSSAVVIRLPYRCMACKFRFGSRYNMSPSFFSLHLPVASRGHRHYHGFVHNSGAPAMKDMRPEDIPAFIQEVQATGCRPIAVGDRMYIIGDADLPEPQCENVQPVLAEIGKRYGRRDHLVEEIAAHLRSLGLSHELPSTH